MRTKFAPIFTAAIVSILTVGVISPAAFAADTTTEYSLTVADGQVSTVVDKIKANGGIVKQSSEELNTIVADMPATEASKIDNLPGTTVTDALDIHVDGADTVNVTPTMSWGLDRIDQKLLPLNSTYSYPGSKSGQGVYVYVVDTGVRSDHEQFTGRILAGYDGVKDGNGTEDCYGHGTHVAGIAAGSTVGVAPNAYIIPVRVFSCTGTSTGAGFYGGLQFVLDDWASKGYPPAVVNLSLSGPADPVLDNAMQVMHDAGLFIAAAAGNDGGDACTKSPARSNDVIAVGATTSTDTKASWSNYGSCVDIFAPGSSITSAYKTSSYATAFMSGTSMATPHVAGAAARYLTAFPNATVQEIDDAILNASTDNILSSVGTGSPNKLLNINPNGYAKLPTAPASITVTQGTRPTTADITFTAPTSDGGANIDNYQITVSPSTGVTGSLTRTTTNTGTYSFTGLTAGVAYTFTVSATNFMGTGPTITSAPITLIATKPDAPTGLTVNATITLDAVTLTWTAPDNDGGTPITGYTVSYQPTDLSENASTINAGINTNATISGLTLDKEYTFTVSATNNVGTSIESSPAKITLLSKIPDTPLNVSSAQKTGTVDTATIKWDAALPGTGNVTEYVVTATPAGSISGSNIRSAGTNTSYNFTGLTPGVTYAFTVVAKNSKGSSDQSLSTSTLIVGTVAAAPTTLTAKPANFGQVNLTWVAPTFTGGVPLTGYTLTATPTAGGTAKTFNLTTAQTSYSVTGLTGLTQYTFAIIANNQYGASTAGTINATPYAPATIVTGAKVSFPSSLKAVFTWSQPYSLGGAPLQRYEARYTTNNTNTTWSNWASTGLTKGYAIFGVPKGVTRYIEIRTVTSAGIGATVRYSFRPTI